MFVAVLMELDAGTLHVSLKGCIRATPRNIRPLSTCISARICLRAQKQPRSEAQSTDPRNGNTPNLRRPKCRPTITQKGKSGRSAVASTGHARQPGESSTMGQRPGSAMTQHAGLAAQAPVLPVDGSGHGKIPSMPSLMQSEHVQQSSGITPHGGLIPSFTRSPQPPSRPVRRRERAHGERAGAGCCLGLHVSSPGSRSTLAWPSR